MLLGADPAAQTTRTDELDPSVVALMEPLVGLSLAHLTTRLESLGALSSTERESVRVGAAAAVQQALWRRLARVTVLELNGAKLTGRLAAADPVGRWREWVATVARPGGWQELARPYPELLSRVQRLTDNRCRAALRLACRLARDRAEVTALLGRSPGPLQAVMFGAGDSHHAGQTVAVLRFAAGQVVYKPRPVEVDAALGTFLSRLLPDEPARIRVPRVRVRRDRHGGYGWAEYIDHRYCSGPAELRQFYRGLGHWLAVMRLLRGSDLHFENLIAAGAVPVVVDCETLFNPYHPPEASGYGAAVDIATSRVSESVLRTGLLPGRGSTLGLRGADPSAAGRLPGQQPVIYTPAIVDLGTDHARVAMTATTTLPGGNLPSPTPELHEYWPYVVDGFTELTGSLRARDEAGELADLLDVFGDCQVRVVARDTAVYAMLERMLWHPTSLHDPEQATQRARKLLATQAETHRGAPRQPQVIAAEVADLLGGDVPVFSATCRTGVLTGPNGSDCGTVGDLVAAALARWRAADLWVDQQVVQASLVSAYLTTEWGPSRRGVGVARVRHGERERRRRSHLAGILRQLADHAIRGRDGTATWVAPVLDAHGWVVRPLGPDLYAGTAGVAVLLAGYQREVHAGRADPVTGVAELLPAVVATLRLGDDRRASELAEAVSAGIRLRPAPCGGYIGLGSQIWGWLLLGDLGAVPAAEANRRARAAAARLPEALSADRVHDLVVGAAGAVVPLLRLAERTGEPQWRALAVEIAHRLRDLAKPSPAGVCWPTQEYPDGIGGLSHGVTGFGWALARLAAVTGDPTTVELARAAFAHEEALYDQQLGGWLDARRPPGQRPTTPLWCHGSVGVGIVANDLIDHGPPGIQDHRDVLRRAARASWPAGFGASHLLCHGDLSAWELVDRACQLGLGPPGLDREQLAAYVLTSLDEHGPSAGLVRDVFSPAIMSGLGGTAYQLLRMHPDSELPSVLLPDPGPGTAVPLPIRAPS